MIEVAVIGAGIIGTAIAVALQQDGFHPAIFDPDGAGGGAAIGSASYIAVGEIFPLAHASLIAALPRMLRDPLGPLVVRPSYLPRMAGWGLRFLSAMRPEKYEQHTRALASLNRAALESLREIAAIAGADDFIDCSGGLLVCERAESLRALEDGLDTLAAHSVQAQILSTQALHQLEPSLAPHLAGAVFFPGSARCTEPTAFEARLATHVLTNGAQLVKERVEEISPQRDGSWEIITPEAAYQARRVVVAAGVWSGKLLTALGYTVPIETERGYHLMLPDSRVTLNHTVVFHERHFVATPLLSGLRLAGTVEFAGTSAPMNPRRSDILYDLATGYLPGIRRDGATRWMGFRPSFPDSLPAIGRAPNHTNLYYCFGHQHLGLTQAGISAKLVADLLQQRPSRLDLRPFSLSRF